MIDWKLDPIPTEALQLGESVIIRDPKHPMHDELGEIYRVRESMSGSTRISVIFESGEVYGARQDQLILA